MSEKKNKYLVSFWGFVWRMAGVSVGEQEELQAADRTREEEVDGKDLA